MENGVKAAACGFRSAFRDWAGNVSNFPREITETSGRKDKGAELIVPVLMVSESVRRFR